jgi:hypothetical protein
MNEEQAPTEAQTQVQEIIGDSGNCQPEKPPKIPRKRDIFRFNGEKPTVINLEHVTHMALEGKRIHFNFYTNTIYVDLENEEVANSVFNVLLNCWSGDL